MRSWQCTAGVLLCRVKGAGAGCGYVTAKAHDSLLWYELFGRGAGRNKPLDFPFVPAHR
jgi:hypothetical protein